MVDGDPEAEYPAILVKICKDMDSAEIRKLVRIHNHVAGSDIFSDYSNYVKPLPVKPLRPDETKWAVIKEDNREPHYDRPRYMGILAISIKQLQNLPLVM